MRPHYRQLPRHIVQNRIHLMHHRFLLPLRGGRVFFVVVGLDLPGDTSPLALLERDGYSVMPLR